MPFAAQTRRHLSFAFSLLIFAGAALISADPVASQSTAEAAKISSSLDAGSRAVIERLGALRELPDGAWKTHSGDLAHGEAVNLDESSWQEIERGGKASYDAVWFRQTYQVPQTLSGYDLTGSRIWFQFHASANGPMPQILYFNGRRVAMGDDLEPIVLLDQAKPGDTVTVAVKLLHTIDRKSFEGATLRIEYPESRPNPTDLRTEFQSAALLVPSLAPKDPSQLTTLNDAIHAVNVAALDHAESGSPITRSESQFEFDTSLKVAQSRLEALRPLLQQATLHLTGNSHIDAAWLWPWTETVDVVKRTFGTALQLMYEYPDYTYTQSAAAYNAWLADKYPDMNAEIARRIKEGRWEVVGGMWVEPDLNMPDGESLVRQLLVGKRWYKQAYGVDVRIGWNPDSFGYTWQLPQIYKKSGVDYFVTQKMAWNDTNQLPFKLFWWESPDGSKVLAYFPHDYANDNLDPVRLANDLATARTKSPGETEMMDLYGVGDHGGGPTRAILDEGFHWAQPNPSGSAQKSPPESARANTAGAEKESTAAAVGSAETNHASSATSANPAINAGSPCSVSGHDFSRANSVPSKEGALAPADSSNCPVTPKIEFGLAQPFFSAVEKQIAPESPVWNYQSIAKGYTPPPPVEGKMSIPTWKSEMYFEYHRGVMTTQANHKKNMRDAEEEVINAEKWSSLAWLDGQKYPAAELTEDWKKVLFNQFHDLAAGSGIGVIYKDAQKDYDVVRWSTNEIDASALGIVAERINTNSARSVPVVIFNPLGWERSGDVIVQAQLPFDADTAFLEGTREDSNYLNEPGVLSYDAKTGVAILKIHATKVPPLGYKVLWIDYPKGESAMTPIRDLGNGTSQYILQNQYVRIAINKTNGCIESLFDERSKFEALASSSCGNQLQAFKDTPKDYDAWNIDSGTLDQPPTLLTKADSVELIGQYPYQAIRVTCHWQNSKFVQTISLTGDQIDIDNEIDWHESHVLLKAAFPLAATSDFATYEIPYGTIDRPTTRNNSWEKAQFEVPAMRWADLSGAGPDGKVHGLSVINNSKYGYDAVGNTLRLTLLRSPKWPDPEADMGHHHFHYALYPHAGTWKDALTVRHGYEYNYPLTAVVTTAHPGTLPASHSFASVEPENVVLTAVKKAEDANGLIFRVYEWAGKESTVEFHVPPGATAATVTNLMETPEGDPLPVTHETAGDLVKAPIHPYEILTIRVDYPNGGPK